MSRGSTGAFRLLAPGAAFYGVFFGIPLLILFVLSFWVQQGFERVPDLTRYPELCFLDRFDMLVPALLFLSLFGLGALLNAMNPSLGTSGFQMVVWGLISTIVLGHATFTINSLSHLFGSRPYETTDTSRNNPWLAILTLGEGWHNNHHYYQPSARNGFLWWEYDLTYYGLVVLKTLGLVWDLNPVPATIVQRRWKMPKR